MLKIIKKMEKLSPYYHLGLGIQLQKESQMLLGRSLQLNIIFKEYDLLGKQWLETASLYAQLAEVYEDEARKEFDVVDNWIKMKYDEIGY